MNFLRSLARPLLAAPFIVSGCDAVLRPSRHAEKLCHALPLTTDQDSAAQSKANAKLLAQVSGGIALASGLGLATGKAPRCCAGVLAGLSVPLAVVNNPVWRAQDAQKRKDAVNGLLRDAALGAGLVLACLDREGKPSLAWRYNHRRQTQSGRQAL